MFIPIGDYPNPRGLPIVNYALLAINVAIYLLISLPLTLQPPGFELGQAINPAWLAQFVDRAPSAAIARYQTAYDVFVYQWGFRPADPSVLTLFSSMFLHGGWLHLAGNMLFLFIYGDNVEHRLGHFGYLVAYLATGVAATLGYAAIAPQGAGDIPMIGASGAISGVLGFYLRWFPHNRVRLFVFLFPFFVDVWMVSARLVLGFYLIIENLLPFLLTRNQATGGVAHGAHLGGFVAGLLAALLIDLLRRASRRRSDRDEP